jgi:hypothetical protein
MIFLSALATLIPKNCAGCAGQLLAAVRVVRAGGERGARQEDCCHQRVLSSGSLPAQVPVPYILKSPVLPILTSGAASESWALQICILLHFLYRHCIPVVSYCVWSVDTEITAFHTFFVY